MCRTGWRSQTERMQNSFVLAAVLLLLPLVSGGSIDKKERGLQSCTQVVRGMQLTRKRGEANEPTDAHVPRTVSSPNGELIWHQHEDTAVYDFVSLSRKGFLAASTRLNPPITVEVYTIGGKSVSFKAGVNTTGEMGGRDVAAISRDSTIAAGVFNIVEKFTMGLYVWDVSKASGKPEWVEFQNASDPVSVAVSGDGSIVAAFYHGHISYLLPPAVTVRLFSGHAAETKVLATHTGQTGELAVGMALSGDGSTVAYTSKLGNTTYLTVLQYLASEQKFTQSFSAKLMHVAEDVAISSNGEHVSVSGAIDYKMELTVFSRLDGDQFAYVARTISGPSNSLISDAFSENGKYLATAWARDDCEQNFVVVYHLPSGEAAFKYDYKPSGGAAPLPDIPTSIAISASGQYIVVGSYGDDTNTPGTQQIQVFKLGQAEPVLRQFTPGSMFAVDIMETDNGVFVAAGGKKIHAIIQGNGGDLYLYKLKEPSLKKEQQQKSVDLNAPAVDLELIESINKKNIGWTAGVNEQFRGMKMSDVRQLMGTTLMEMDSIASLPSDPARAEVLPESFDARKQWPDCVRPIRNQGSCGACWAVSASEVLSARLCIATEGKVNDILSPQYMVDCDTLDHGCTGGFLEYAWRFLTETGIPLDSCYPYSMARHACSANCTAGGAPLKKFRALPKTMDVFKSVEEMQESIMKYGPIQAAFTVYSDLMSYKSGVYKHTGGMILGGHGIKVVGWGVDEASGEKYWILGNSWGKAWGDLGGYFWFQRGTNQCQLESNAVAGQADTSRLV